MSQATEFRMWHRRRAGSRPPWAIILLLTALFFLIDHDLFRVQLHQATPATSAAEIAEATAEGSTVRRVGLLSLGLFGAFMFLRKDMIALRINGVLGWLTLFFFFGSVVSLTWADNIELTSRRVVVLIVLCLGALAAARCLSERGLLFLAFFSSFLFLLIGISAELASGALDPWSPNYRFAGTLHPNHQGWNSATLLFASIALARTPIHRRFLYPSAAFLAMVFLLLTKSRTAVASAFLALVLYWLLCLPKFKIFLYVCTAMSMACLFFLTLGDKFLRYVGVAILLGRQDVYDTLTGRIPLWRELLPYIWQRPIGGYGFNGFWIPERHLKISGQVGWGVPGAHNGFIDLILGIGILGAACYMGMLLVALIRLINHYNTDHNPATLFGVMMLVFFSLVMLTDEIAWETSMPTYIVLTIVAQLGLTEPKTSLRAKHSR